MRCRVLCRKTIGAGTSVRLGFPNARPVVSDERSEEFRRAVKESLNGPFQANRSDGIKPGIGIERKKIKPTIFAPLVLSFNLYKIPYSFSLLTILFCSIFFVLSINL